LKIDTIAAVAIALACMAGCETIDDGWQRVVRGTTKGLFMTTPSPELHTPP